MSDENQRIEFFIKMMKSDNAKTRLEACALLGASPIRTQEVIEAFQNALNDSDTKVAEVAKKALEGRLPAKSEQRINRPPPKPSPIAIENIQKWQHLWEFVFLNDGEYTLIVDKNNVLTGRAVWDYLASLGKYGWELISVAPQIGDTNPQKGKSSTLAASLMDFAIAGPRVTTMTQHMTGTTGYFFWYKRPM